MKIKFKDEDDDNYLRRRVEGKGGRMDGEIGDIEDDEGGIGDDVEVDGDGASEVAGGEVWFEAYVIVFRNSEFGEARLPFELLHRLKQKQKQK